MKKFFLFLNINLYIFLIFLFFYISVKSKIDEEDLIRIRYLAKEWIKGPLLDIKTIKAEKDDYLKCLF